MKPTKSHHEMETHFLTKHIYTYMIHVYHVYLSIYSIYIYILNYRYLIHNGLRVLNVVLCDFVVPPNFGLCRAQGFGIRFQACSKSCGKGITRRSREVVGVTVGLGSWRYFIGT